MKLRLNKTVAAVATSALLLVGVPAFSAASASGAAAKPTFVIGYQGPLTGGNAQLGLNMVYGVQLAVNNANKLNTLPFKLKVAKYDDQGSGTIAPAQAQAAIANKNLVAVVGPAFSTATRNSEVYYSVASVATVSPSATNPLLTLNKPDNNFFRMVFGDDVQGAADAKFLKDKGLTKLQIVDDGSFYGSGLAAVVEKYSRASGATVDTNTLPATSNCGGTASTTQYAGAASAAVAANYTGIFYGGYYCDLGLFLGALASAGYHGAVMSGDGSEDPALITGTTPASAANGVYISAGGGGAGGNLSGKLATQYKALSGFAASTALYASQAYDATNIIIEALKKTWKTRGGLHSLRLATVLQIHKTNWKGITGKVRFNNDGSLVGSSKGAINFFQVVSGALTQVGHS